ncbi:hypothetical protein CTAM01_04859 [Colletotrichum tamarilloi]|uniref:Uncharacterized protein n=1 Tax=Colletotrichum tamarilloi TaxID=1209934 RepID=A0ABQ9RFQ8_9PEZI|nr:uncharacterized protein CTAM01_04859 [Colletotrichum tamarilloi]KAK1502870.1 hypothetical protein CTAM01_04859 [Colletotrichum tamarilloi]
MSVVCRSRGSRSAGTGPILHGCRLKQADAFTEGFPSRSTVSSPERMGGR